MLRLWDLPFVIAVLQSFAIGIAATIIAQLIEEYRMGDPFSIDLEKTARFLSIGVVTTPLNYWWQALLEYLFPDPMEPSHASIQRNSINFPERNISMRSIRNLRDEDCESLSRESSPLFGATAQSGSQSEHKSLRAGKRLKFRNILAKWLIDCFLLGSWWNGVLFFVLVGVVNGKEANLILQDVRTRTVPFVLDSFKVWPLAALVALTMIKVEKRIVFYSAVGFCWGIYMALIAIRT